MGLIKDFSEITHKNVPSTCGKGNGNPLLYSCLENPVDRGAWWAAVHRVAQSRTWLKRLSMHVCIGEGNGSPLQYSCLENPRDGKPGGLPSTGSHRVGHDWSDLAAAAATNTRKDAQYRSLLEKCKSKLQWDIISPHTSHNGHHQKVYKK